MGYVGGGVGHYKVEIAEEPDLPEDSEQVHADAPEPDLDEDVVQPEPVIQDMLGDNDHPESDFGSDSDSDDSAGESSNKGSVVGEGEEDGSDDLEEDLGPEDGEDLIGEEDENSGYAPL
ncbi:hypothetical protein DFH08DRAFT_941485 [Mycena albidolilacea]|uniref:Uncharacterized protein n=1 Tax=Mycena albidolilacea TaxID=1033008 RepID=A0AAD6ZI71_9AGAR|nr:hypothetical protein DFH08DRAFT_941485 [Mycena albidolilacea]